ncbi:MAG: type II/IV secretion system ATPase subunit [Candidatus Aenigmarchaeota archaeon]|nr:type II/IV secretion system ATPase subunit [Candidatus Aenigmarchaeota archaeon]
MGEKLKEKKGEKETTKKSYILVADNVKADVKIYMKKEDYVSRYDINYPKIKEGTSAVLGSIKQELIKSIGIKGREVLDPQIIEKIKADSLKKSEGLIKKHMPSLSEERRKTLAGQLLHEMFGLGSIELLLKDDDLEEIVINNSLNPPWVYHKEFGWLKTNITLKNEDETYNYASMIGRRIGRQITNLMPLMDAHLITGDRVNATLFPISTKGNTLTIRKFARNPWTITHLIDPKSNTMSKEVAALLWLCLEYELNMIIAGGTASGKTSLLNALTPFIPPTHRIVSIEDTRELQLPEFLHWVPLTTREPNPEGKGEVNMLELMINSLRMRPDRMIVGEIRRQRQAEVLFEAMHTGHSVYATLHANTADEVRRRMINPPISLPESMLEALHLTCVQFRQRRLGIRRTFELAEFVPTREPGGKSKVRVNVLYMWNPRTDRLEKTRKAAKLSDISMRLVEEIQLHTGMSEKELENDLKEKEKILQWAVDNNIKTVNTVGKIMADYYKDKEYVLELVKKKEKPQNIFEKNLLEEMKARGLIK